MDFNERQDAARREESIGDAVVKLENSPEANTGGIFKLGERPLQGPIP